MSNQSSHELDSYACQSQTKSNIPDQDASNHDNPRPHQDFSRSGVHQAFDANGFIVLRQFYDNNNSRTTLQAWQTFCENHFQACFKTLHVNGHITIPQHEHANGTDPYSKKYALECGVPHGFKEIVMRSPGRYELSLLHLPTKERPEFEATLLPPLQPILKECLNARDIEQLKLCHLSLLIATPGCSDQSWHADGGHVDITQHMPCHVLNVFIPLQDVSRCMGPTEFRPGGHYLTRNLAAMMLAAKCRKTLRAPTCPELQVGDIIIFDYRCLHRGRANRTGYGKMPAQNRNYLVLTYSQPWFEDILNFPKNKSMHDPVAANQGASENEATR